MVLVSPTHLALQRIAAVPAGDPLRVAEEGANGVDVVDAVIQDLQPLLRGQPRPHVPRRVDADLDARRRSPAPIQPLRISVRGRASPGPTATAG